MGASPGISDEAEQRLGCGSWGPTDAATAVSGVAKEDTVQRDELPEEEKESQLEIGAVEDAQSGQGKFHAGLFAMVVVVHSSVALS